MVIETVLGFHFGGVFGEFATRFSRTYCLWLDWDVHWGYGFLIVTHGQITPYVDKIHVAPLGNQELKPLFVFGRIIIP